MTDKEKSMQILLDDFFIESNVENIIGKFSSFLFKENKDIYIEFGDFIRKSYAILKKDPDFMFNEIEPQFIKRLFSLFYYYLKEHEDFLLKEVK